MTRGVFKTDLAEDDGNLNDTIEIQVSLRNLPRNKAGKLEKCEITGKRPAMHDDWSELVVDGTEVNESPDSARSVSLAQVLALMQNRDRLIFCVVLTPRNSNEIYFNEPGWTNQMGTEYGENMNNGYKNLVRYANLKYCIVD